MDERLREVESQVVALNTNNIFTQAALVALQKKYDRMIQLLLGLLCSTVIALAMLVLQQVGGK